MRQNGIEAKGQPKANGEFVVLAGSEVSPTEVNSCPRNVKEQRMHLNGDGTIANNKFTRDKAFTKPYIAASVICGKNVNGNDAWVLPLDSDTAPKDCKNWKRLGTWNEERKQMATSATEPVCP